MEIISGEKYLLDTNILVYSLNKQSSFYLKVCGLLQGGQWNTTNFVIAQQNLIELVSVLCKMYKISIKDALADAKRFAVNFEVINPMPTTFMTYARLITNARNRLHPFDAYLVATMLDNNIKRIITANKKDFQNLNLEQIVEIG